jgi:ABC-type branched-subunit amino acid transport system substrate-binding protein
VTAYVAYFNSTSSICGRKLKLIDLDSGTSESGDQQASQSACGSAFAMVGSMGAFDAGGASTVAKCGIPDLRAASTETARQKSPVTFGAYSLATDEIPSAPFDWFKSHFGDAYKNAAFVYLNAGASSLNADSFMAGESKLGFNFKDKIAIDVTSVPNYNGYATQLKSDGIKYVQYIGAYQYAQKLKAAMEQQDYHPVFLMDSVAYDPNFVAAGSSVNGTYVFLAGPMFEEANRNPQLATYLQWLQRTSGGAPSFFGVYAWSAAALFVESALELGGKLTRSSLISHLQGVHSWTNHGMTQPQDVGGTHTTHCTSIIQLQNGKWVRKTPYPYTCGGIVNTGVGG